MSARIAEEYQRSDGQFFPGALQHVLATLDPRIPQLGPWQSIEASAAYDGDLVIDLSGSTFEGSGQRLTAAALGLPADTTSAEIDALLDALEETAAEDDLLAEWGKDLRQPQCGAGEGNAELSQLAGIRQAVELANVTDEIRILEDAQDTPRLSEDRLARAIGRIGRGT